MFKLIILLALVFNINCQLPKFPRYVGIGYDVATGNPLQDQIDTGFRHNIFDLTYENGKTTEDRKFLVPDKMIARTRNSCKYTATTNEYRGSTEYQKDLSTLVEVSASASAFLVETSFSASTEFKQMEETTTENEKTVMNSGAKCEAYSLEMELFDPPTLGTGFKNAITLAAKNSSLWNTVIRDYGTHYIKYGIFGGRMTLQQSIEKTKFQELRSLGVDVKTTASLSYAKFSGDTSVSVSEKEKELNAFESRVEETKELYIGGKPPKSGDWKDWYDEVLEAPMPINYHVNGIVELMTTNHFPEFSEAELGRLQTEFDDALKVYCKERGCKLPSPDQPAPPGTVANKTNSKLFTGIYGGESNINFEDPLPPNPFMIVRRVFLSLDKFKNIYAIRFALSDTLQTYLSDIRGSGNMDGAVSWPSDGNLADGEYITQIDVQWLDTLQSLRFITNRGTNSPVFGNNRGTSENIKLEGNLVGIRGRFFPNSFGVFGFISVVPQYP